MKTKPILSAPVIQNGDRTLNNSIPRKWLALGLAGILFISVCALLPSPAQAQCKHWDVSGKWSLTQDNGHELEVDLQLGKWGQQSANITGTGTMTKGGKHPFAAVISGNITDNSFAMLVRVADMRLQYVGTVRPDGTLSGTYREEGFPPVQTEWSTSHRMKCAEASPPISKPKTGASSTSSAAADQSSSNDTEENHKKKKKKNKKHHHHDDDDQNQGND